MAFMLTFEIMALAKDFGIERLGFLTLTHADHVISMTESQRRFNSLNTHILRKRYRRAVVCSERMQSGRLHLHLLVALGVDIRTGLDFAAVERRDYRSANLALRSEWAFWRKTAPRYGFGRTELLPVKSTAEGIAKYVGKYIGKHVEQREDGDKGRRLLRFLGYKLGERRASTRFQWNSPGSRLWRAKLGELATAYGARGYEDLRALFGPNWAYKLQGCIASMEIGEGESLRRGGVLGYHLLKQNAS